MENSRAGKCYQIALAVLQLQPNSDTMFLIHGKCSGILHAWIEVNDATVWEPTLAGLVSARDFPGEIDHRYTKAEALKLAQTTGHCGPWE